MASDLRLLRTRSFVHALLVCCLSCSDYVVADASGFALRNHNPFLQIFGLPPLQSAAVVPVGDTRFRMSVDLANNADFGATAQEDLFVDGESYFLNMALRRRRSGNHSLRLGRDNVFRSSARRLRLRWFAAAWRR